MGVDRGGIEGAGVRYNLTLICNALKLAHPVYSETQKDWCSWV